MKKIKVTAHRKGKVIRYTRTITPKAVRAAKKNVKIARRKWMNMSPLARRKAMPARNPNPKKKYPVGSILTKDVGKKGGHYIHIKKTKYGWISGPLRKYGGGATSGTKVNKKGFIRKAFTYKRKNGTIVHVPSTRVKSTSYFLD